MCCIIEVSFYIYLCFSPRYKGIVVEEKTCIDLTAMLHGGMRLKIARRLKAITEFI